VTSPARVFDADDIGRVISRIAHEIIERSRGAQNLMIVGIHSRGVPLAQRIAERITVIQGAPCPVGELDVSMYRDDVALRGARPVNATHIPAHGVDGQVVVLVDDVLFSGRTVRAALDALNDIGRPASVQLAVLIDRGHRELPIRADYVGKNLPTSLTETVQVRVLEIDGVDDVLVERKASA